jgi:hypothetical protein
VTSFTAPIDGPVLAPGTGDAYGEKNNSLEAVRHPLEFGQTGKNLKRVTFFKFLLQDGSTGIPARSVITKAELTVVSDSTTTTGAFNADFSLVPFDTDPLHGQFHKETGLKNTIIDDFDFKLAVKDGLATILEETTTAAPNLFFRFKGSLIRGPTRLFQSFKVTTSGVLDTMDLHLFRAGGDGGATVVAEIYNVTTPGANPTASSLLATSDTIAFNSVTTAGGGGVSTFTFTGANQIDITAGVEYAASLNHTGVVSETTRIDWGAVNGNPYTTGSGMVRGPAFGFDTVNYPWRGQLPFPIDPVTDLVDNTHPAFGSTLSIEQPDWSINVRETMGDLKLLIQEWVNDEDYVVGTGSVDSPIGVVVGPGDAAAGSFRRPRAAENGIADAAELEIHYRPRKIQVI